MAGLSSGRGEDLLNLFIRSGCSEATADGMKGEDLGTNNKHNDFRVFIIL